jgi:hypothetical protein
MNAGAQPKTKGKVRVDDDVDDILSMDDDNVPSTEDSWYAPLPPPICCSGRQALYVAKEGHKGAGGNDTCGLAAE